MQYKDFIKNKVALGRTEATIECIKTHLECFGKFYKTKRKKLKTISKRDIEDYLFHLREKGYKPGTIQDRMNALKDFLHYRNIKTFPAFKISRPKALPKFLESNEIKKVRKVIKKERDLLIFNLLYATGMRVSELCSLNCGDINRHSLLITGKGNKERMVEMPKELYMTLKKFISGRNGNEPIFLSKGRRIRREAVSTLLKRYGEKAQLGMKISPHRLRHSFATHCLNRGARIEAVSALLGHSSIAVTQIYARLTNDNIRREYNKFSRTWRS